MKTDRQTDRQTRKLVAKACRKVLGKIHNRYPFFLKEAYASCAVQNKSISFDQAQMLMNNVSPDPCTESYHQNKLDIKCDLQIIIPCYNAENYVVKCLDSIVSQKTDYSVEVTIIEDGSTDNTRAVLKKYVSEHKDHLNMHLKLICQENKGFSGARNAGLETITGRYVMFVDSDDYLADSSIQALMKTTTHSEYEIVEGGYQTFGGRNNWSVKRKNRILKDAIGHLYGYPWGKIYKADLLSNFVFPENYWYEDTALIYRVWTKVRKVATINSLVYHYRINENGITATSIGKPKSLDSTYITGQLLTDLKKYDPELLDEKVYRFTIMQSIINHQRTEGMSEEVRQAAYVYMREYINLNFDSKFKLDHPTKLEESLRGNYDYRKFVAACL